MDAYDNLEEFYDPPNYDIEEGERSTAGLRFIVNSPDLSAGLSWRSPAAQGWGRSPSLHRDWR